MTLPMLADVALRLSCGLAFLLALTPWRLVPLRFFRTHCLVILGLLVVAGLASWQAGLRGGALGGVAVAAVLSYLAVIAWGLGLPRVALPVTAAIAVLTGLELVSDARGAGGADWAWSGAGRLASAFLLGSGFTAMLLGHYYLTAPAMSIDPLKRFVRCMGWGLAARAALAGVGLALWASAASGGSGGGVSPLMLAVRWGMGIVAPAAATFMAWKTVEIRSTQSATGILYIATTLLLFGELTALVLTRESGRVF